MARGAISKEIVTKQILDTFGGAFINGKEIRIPMVEDGDEVQIKCTLTCAKDNVYPNEFAEDNTVRPVAGAVDTDIEPTAEEKAKVAELLDKLGLS